MKKEMYKDEFGRVRKETFRDELGRKVRTRHLTEGGVLDYVNEYFYRGDSKVPERGVQSYFYDDGKVGIRRDAVYLEAEHRMVTVKERINDKAGNITEERCFDKGTGHMTEERFYDEEGNVTKENSFDGKTGRMIKEKEFRKNNQGILYMHQREFEGDGKLKADGFYLRLGGVWWLFDDKKNYKLLNQFENPFKKDMDMSLIKQASGNIR